MHLGGKKMQSGCAQSGLQQPGGLPSGEFLARRFPVEWWTRKTCCSLLPCPCRGMGYAGVGLLCPFLLETSALRTRLRAAQRLSFWELGSQSFPACLSSYSSFRKGVVRAENTFINHCNCNHCNTPYFFPFFFFVNISFISLVVVPINFFGIVSSSWCVSCSCYSCHLVNCLLIYFALQWSAKWDRREVSEKRKVVTEMSLTW